MLVVERTGKGLHRWTLLSLGVFWVQIHNVPPLSMIVAVAEAIRGTSGYDKEGRYIGGLGLHW